MLSKALFIVFGYLLVSPSWAITCYYTLAKDNCWLKYNVTVEVMDAKTSKVLTKVTVPEGQTYQRVTFPCETNGQKLIYNAQFSPSIWESEKGKIYPARNYWSLPDKVNNGDSAWNVSVCYPKDFSEIPMPPTSTGKCKCDFSIIPPIPVKQL